MNSSFDFLLKPKRPTLKDFEFWEKTVEWAFVRKYLSFSLIGAPLGGTMEKAGDALLQSLANDCFCLIEFKRRDVHFSSECEKYPAFGDKKWAALEQHEKDAYMQSFKDLYAAYGIKGNAPHLFVYGIVKESTLGDALKQAYDVAVSQHHAGMFSVTKDFLASAFKLVRNEEKDKRKTVVVEPAGMRYWGPWIDNPAVAEFDGEQASVELSRLSEYGWQLDRFKAYLTALLAAKGSDPTGGDKPGLGWQHSMVLAVSSEGRCLPFTLAEFVTRFAVELAKPEQAKVMYGKGS